MQGEIICVGTELLLGQIINTNAAYLGMKAAELGIDIFRQTVVGDNRLRIQAALEEALRRSEVVFITGGLGPTQDDLTKEVVCEYLGFPLELNEEASEKISGFFAARGMQMPVNNCKQAMFPKESKILFNNHGTAPGVILEKDGKTVIILPGPPSEMQAMFEEQVTPFLQEKMAGQEAVIKSRVIRIWGLGESKVDEILSDLFDEYTNPTIAYLFQQGQVIVRLTAKAASAEEAESLLARLEEKIRERLGEKIFATDGQTLMDIIADGLKRRKWRLVTAESCTGGLVANMITDKPGSSAYFERGFITYSNESKVELLGVASEIIEKYGAVSEECAKAMAAGALRYGNANVALAITGIAGPDGATDKKPIGLVFIALAYPGGCVVKKCHFHGERERVKGQAGFTALHLLRSYLQGQV